MSLTYTRITSDIKIRDMDHPTSATRCVRLSDHLQISFYTATPANCLEHQDLALILKNRCRQELLDRRVYAFNTSVDLFKQHRLKSLQKLLRRNIQPQRFYTHANSPCMILRIKRCPLNLTHLPLSSLPSLHHVTSSFMNACGIDIFIGSENFLIKMYAWWIFLPSVLWFFFISTFCQ